MPDAKKMNLKKLADAVTRDFDRPRGGIEERIELDIRRHRKGWGRFVVTDAAGKPVPGVKIALEQTKHEFRFGCNLFKLGDYPTDRENDIYAERFKKVFNHATVPFYWDTLEPEPGKLRYAKNCAKIPRRPPADTAVDWCLENNIMPKGHWLFCDNFVPGWLPKNGRATMTLLEKRIASLAERYGDKVPVWDAVNEAFSNHRRFHPTIGWSVTPQDYVYRTFKLAEKYFPETTELCYNDGQWIAYVPFAHDNSPVYLLCKELLERGARLGGLGIQFHMYDTLEYMNTDGHLYFDPYRQFQIFDQYARLGVPIHLTEISLPTPQALPRKQAEAFQEKLLRSFYRLWFSHEGVGSIIWWNFADNSAYGDENNFQAGLIDGNLNEKPAFRALDELVNHEWHTSCSVATDADGIADWNGFYGSYAVTLTAGRTRQKFAVELGKDCENEIHLKLK